MFGRVLAINEVILLIFKMPVLDQVATRKKFDKKEALSFDKNCKDTF